MNGTLLWQILFILTLATIILNCFLLEYFSKVTPANPHPVSKALPKFAMYFGIYLGIVVLVWQFFGSISYQVKVVTMSVQDFDVSESNNIFESEFTESLQFAFCGVSFFAALATPILFVGSLLFVACCGIGITFLPFDLINWYVHRPRKMEPEQFVVAKRILQKESETALQLAKETHNLKRELSITPLVDKKKRLALAYEFNQKLNETRYALSEFEDMFDSFQASQKILDSNPLFFYLYLILGIASTVLALGVVIHTILVASGYVGILEYFILQSESGSFIVALFHFAFLTVYFGLVIAYGSGQISHALSGIMGVIHVKPHLTFYDSFYRQINFCLLSFFGLMVFFVRYWPRYLRYIGFDLYFHRILARVSILELFYKFRIPEYLFLGFVLVSVFVLTFSTNGATLLHEKIVARCAEIADEKIEVTALDKIQLKINLV